MVASYHNIPLHSYYKILLMKQLFGSLICIFIVTSTQAQTPKTFSSSDILQQLKKLEVFGSVLYIAAHPDDENTRLLAYLANERRFRTGYMSLTRGDGGQNLIGDEQGIDLGLIRTQELLAARRVDGAEQFFSRAYDFGYSKSPEETMQTWGHDKILSDVVWVIRNFKPDVIITRFPTTGEGGHGHHTASAILAGEAFDAAADATKFPEQLINGVTVWQAKRLLWNTFNFGGNNTQREDQLKIDVGMYNPILGKSYGEMAAQSRSQHKSQGFGVPAQRGESLEYFATIKGDKPETDLMDAVDITSKKMTGQAFDEPVKNLLENFKTGNSVASLPALLKLYNGLQQQKESFWRNQKLKELLTLIEATSGIFMEATSTSPYAVQGDSLKVSLLINNRVGVNIKNATVQMDELNYVFKDIEKNKNITQNISLFIPLTAKLTQPYWLQNEMNHGSFNVTDQALIGRAENDDAVVSFNAEIDGVQLTFKKPIRYKFTDPVKGELYQPVAVVPALSVIPVSKTVVNLENKKTSYNVHLKAFKELDLSDTKLQSVSKEITIGQPAAFISPGKLLKGDEKVYTENNVAFNRNGTIQLELKRDASNIFNREVVEIKYDHIPAIQYSRKAEIKILKADIKTAGNRVGYIAGAGDKVPQALEQMGYEVIMLGEKDLTIQNLKQLDAIITGVRAHNTNAWLSNAYDVLMQYVKEGGVLLVQYNTNNSIGPVKAKISPYPFTISRSRVTDETAVVNFLMPDHPVLNYPNKITAKDFDGWIQERSIYNAEAIDSNYQRILSMKDPGEKEQEGSLIVSNYGKGRFVYTGLVFFRELPAGIPGAYRLFANLIAAPKSFNKEGNLKSLKVNR